VKVEVRGGPLAVTEALPPGDAVGTVLLVPGFTGSKEDFRLLLQPLADAGYRVVAYDQRGQFESPGPDDGSAYAVDALAADLIGLVDALALEPVHLVGHSFGGLVARAAVVQDRAVARSLTLLASGPAALAGPRAQAMEHVRPLLADGGLLAVADLMDAVASADPRRANDPPELRAFLRRRFLANSAFGLVATGDALLAEPDRVEELRSTGIPVLVAYGVADDAWPPAVQAEMAERLGARHIVIPDAYHSPAVENVEATVQCLLEFFASA
jgi:pimeloyl-ACP methyl ester carboxylesterase